MVFIKLTTDLFENVVPYSLDLEMSSDRISIYRKDTNTKLYMNYTAWISSLVKSALKICSCNKLSQELKLIKKVASWNDFPKYMVNVFFVKLFRHIKVKLSLILL